MARPRRRLDKTTSRQLSTDVKVKPVRSQRRWPLVLGIVVLLLIGFVFAAWWGNRVVAPDRPLQQIKVSAEEFERGRYLARAADCAACHQTTDGAAYAGGSPLKTPFGTIYGTNITPDPDRGIGRWSADEFYRALTLGKAPGGRNLYPAMPYTSYHSMTREDSALMYAYFMNVRPNPKQNIDPDMPFPFNLRVLLSGWNLLFFDKDTQPGASAGSSAVWERGAYVSNVLGHCAACHTPRNALGAMKRDEWLQGYALDKYLAPSLTPNGLLERDWDAQAIQQFMHSGIAPQGNAFGEMHPVVMHSSQYLSQSDLTAMTTFLFGDVPPAGLAPATPDGAAPVASTTPSRDQLQAQAHPMPAASGALSAAADTRQLIANGRRQYVAVCAGCHGAAGEGIENVMPSLQLSSTVRDSNPRNLVLLTLHGLPAQQFPGTARSGMPGFAQQLSDADIAALVNYSRTAWGGQPADVMAAAVEKLRKIE